MGYRGVDRPVEKQAPAAGVGTADAAEGGSPGAYRRLAGGVMGAAFGLAYGLAYQVTTWVTLPDIPYQGSRFGAFGGIALGVLWGAFVGALTAWPTSAVWGIALGSTAMALAFIARSVVDTTLGSQPTGNVLVTMAVLIMPVLIVNIPAIAILRWAAQREETAASEGVAPGKRLWFPLILLLVVVIAGAFSLVPSEARQVIRNTNEMLQEGLGASGPEAIPSPLRGEQVGDFLRHANAHYTLEWDNRNLERFAIDLPPTNWNEHQVVIAHFDDGWMLACQYPTPDAAPACRGYEGGRLPEATWDPARKDVPE